MKSRIVPSLLAVSLIALPAAAQNQSLTSFKDSVGDHIYYQHDGSSGGPNNSDLFQIAPTFPWAGDMNQLSSGCNPPPEIGYWPSAGSPLASFTDGFGQHVLYIDNKMHVRDLLFSGSCGNLDLTYLASLLFPLPLSDGISLVGFSDERGEHAYYTAVDGHIHHLLYLGGQVLVHEDLTLHAYGLKAWEPCSFRTGPLTAFADTRSQPTIELVYYVGGGDLCEFAWYQGYEQSVDLTAICAAGCGAGAPHPMVLNPLTGLPGPLSGFADASGQHVFYLDNALHVHQFLAGPSGLSTLDLTATYGGNPAVADSLTGFSNAWGPQVFYVDASQHVNQLMVSFSTHRDLTNLFGGALTLPARQSPCSTTPVVNSPGTSLSSISFDDRKGEDVFYVGADRHVWELHSSDGFTWSSFDLTQDYGGTTTFGTVVVGPCPPIG